ncbi:hypothetical protein [Alteromonas facilis]|uniref:hypothetical protein n=1 Tax=Alteromonas facilis TaxID=2048004 RepID=UPI000C288DD5|nr:hypothetical protein [Alteromonas facilis]
MITKQIKYAPLKSIGLMSRFKGVYFLTSFVTKLDRQGNAYARMQIDDLTGSQVVYCRDASCIHGKLSPNSLVHIEARFERGLKGSFLCCKYIQSVSSKQSGFNDIQQLPMRVCRDQHSLIKMVTLLSLIRCESLKRFVIGIVLSEDVGIKLLKCPTDVCLNDNNAKSLLSDIVTLAQSLLDSRHMICISGDIAIAVGLLYDIGKCLMFTHDARLASLGFLLSCRELTMRICAPALVELEKTNPQEARTLAVMLGDSHLKSRLCTRPFTQSAQHLSQTLVLQR